jgi:alpha 1,2-mannosyltransferase
MGFPFAKITKIDHYIPGRRLPARYYLLILLFFLCLHLILSNIHESYRRATSLSKIAPSWLLNGNPYPWHQSQAGKFDHPSVLIANDKVNSVGSANATFYILARNWEVKQLVKSLSEIEARFNHRHHYPYVFLNDEPFTDDFKE